MGHPGRTVVVALAVAVAMAGSVATGGPPADPTGGPARATVATGGPPAAPPSVATPVDGTTTRAAAEVAAPGIVPGHVDRSSLFLDATYDASLELGWASRRIVVDATATVRNDSGAAIDRLELNTIAARLGAFRLRFVRVDGRRVAATTRGQTIMVPLGGILPVGATTVVRVRYRATLRNDVRGSNWLFTRANGVVDLYRWLPWVSRRIRFERPNHGDPFETPSSRSVVVRIQTSRPLRLATTGRRTSVSSDGLTQTFEAHDVRDFNVTAATDYMTRTRVVGDTVVRVFSRRGSPGGALLDAAADALERLERRLGPYPQPTFRVAQSAGAFGMESPGLIWIPAGTPAANLRYLVTHETAHQWFYGSVGSHQAREPFTDEAAADFVARHVLGLRRASRCATTRLDRRIYDYSSACYYEVVYIQGGNLLDAARREMTPAVFWPALRAYLAANRNRLVTTATLLEALDAATPVDLGARLFARRFPRLY